MPQLTHLTASALAVAAILLLPGCTGDAPIVLPSPESSTAPVFATDEEALAAAEAAYGEYLRVSDEILMDGGDDPERLLTVATPELFEVESEGYATARELGQRSTGGSKFDSMELQQYVPAAAGGKSIVVVYACNDISEVDFLDARGQSVVAPGRVNRIPVEITFDHTTSGSSTLLVAAEENWTGGNFCELE
jgi:hypothetical protein